MNNELRPIRILFPFIAGDRLGGSHISALKLISALDRRRFEPVILLHYHTQTMPNRLASYISNLGLSFIETTDIPLLAPSSRKGEPRATLVSFAFKTLPNAIRLLREQEIDIVHTNDGRIHVNWSIAARLAGCRVVWHHREDPSSFGVNKLGPFTAHRIVTVSKFARPARPLLPVSNKTSVIFSPFDLPKPPDDPTAREKLLAEIGGRSDALMLGYFGSLVPRKRPLDFVRAVEATKRALPDREVHGLFFGEAILPDSPLDTQAAELAASLGISNNIHFMGFRSPIETIMSAIDVMLVTAMNEPFGRTLIEGMHLGTPVVATEHGGNTEAIEHGETGLLVPLGDAEAMAAAVKRLETETGLRKSIVDTARHGLEARYGVARHVAQTSEIYDDLVPSHRLAEKTSSAV